MAAITVGQIKATANKLIDDMRQVNLNDIEQYDKSFLRMEDFKRFCEVDAVAKTIVKAYEFLSLPENNRVIEIKVSITEESETSYSWNSVSVNRKDSLEEILNKVFQNRLTYKCSFVIPNTNEMIDKLNYKTLSIGNLLEVEQQVVQELYKDAFKVEINYYE